MEHHNARCQIETAKEMREALYEKLKAPKRIIKGYDEGESESNMAKDLIQRTVNTVVALLAEDQSHWSSQKLSGKLAEVDLFPGNLKMGTLLETMVASGIIAGEVNRGVLHVYHKPKGTNEGYTEEEVTQREEALRHSIRVKETECIGLRDATRKLLADVQEANKRAEEAKGKERVIRVEIKNGAKITKAIENELFHVKYEKLLQLAQARKNILAYGPTGSGKSHTAQQVAKGLGLYFGMVSCTAGMSEGVLGGRLLPLGVGGRFEYVMSEFIKCFEKGGLFFLDEIDAADANVLLLINSALANGVISVTNRSKAPYAQRHKDFVCMAAANTLGTNGDRLYTGRNKLDTSTLDRFQVGKVFIDYDPHIEHTLCPDVRLLNKCWKIREAIQQHRLERAMSTRFIKEAHEMKVAFNWTDKELFGEGHDGFYSGWREDEVSKVRQYIGKEFSNEEVMPF